MTINVKYVININVTSNVKGFENAAECRQLAAFEKRLVTYWRRYGASKLKTWTFISD